LFRLGKWILEGFRGFRAFGARLSLKEVGVVRVDVKVDAVGSFVNGGMLQVIRG
jgi:hypothetical protein